MSILKRLNIGYLCFIYTHLHFIFILLWYLPSFCIKKYILHNKTKLSIVLNLWSDEALHFTIASPRFIGICKINVVLFMWMILNYIERWIGVYSVTLCFLNFAFVFLVSLFSPSLKTELIIDSIKQFGKTTGPTIILYNAFYIALLIILFIFLPPSISFS